MRRIRIPFVVPAIAMAGVVFVGTLIMQHRFISRSNRANVPVHFSQGPAWGPTTLDSLALAQAKAWGDARPSTVFYVVTTRQAANEFAADSAVNTNPIVYLVVMRGQFEWKTAPLPPSPDAKPPTGTTAVIIVSQQTGMILDFGISSRPLSNLSTLGSVHALGP